MRVQDNRRSVKLPDLFGRIRPVIEAMQPGRRQIPPVAPPPDLTLLFQAQARGAGFSERVIQAVLGYYRIAPSLTVEQLHQLALLFEDVFEEGRRHA
jgi:hypothetical protein